VTRVRNRSVGTFALRFSPIIVRLYVTARVERDTGSIVRTAELGASAHVQSSRKSRELASANALCGSTLRAKLARLRRSQ
jgi:hypothetical protein